MRGLAKRLVSAGSAGVLALVLAGGVTAAQPTKYSATLLDNGSGDCTFRMEASWKGGREVVQVYVLLYQDRAVGGAADLQGFSPDQIGSTLSRTSAMIPIGPLEADTAGTHTFQGLVSFVGETRGSFFTLGQVTTNQISMGCKRAGS
jgi:hypothetical protein